MNLLAYVAAGLLALALTALGVQTWRVESVYKTLAAEQAARQADRIAAQQAVIAATAAFRVEEQRRTAAIQEAAHAAEKQVTQARADALSAGAAADRLRERAARLASRGCAVPVNTAVASNSTPADNAGLVLWDVLGPVVEEARRLASLADDRGIAGQACEWGYDKVSEPDVHR